MMELSRAALKADRYEYTVENTEHKLGGRLTEARVRLHSYRNDQIALEVKIPSLEAREWRKRLLVRPQLKNTETVNEGAVVMVLIVCPRTCCGITRVGISSAIAEGPKY